ncbi:MAG: WYL domain-containing protein [Candidatus Delongbacteria bacterium]|nr:WYL domain-containing protein [Candidatus Delongbacteria bacterium]MDD4205186.1 WYL domain-containing protein [Candidatus Delongbacteria bacterium]
MTEKNNVSRIGFMISELNRKGHFSRQEVIDHVRETTGTEISESTVKRSVSDIRDHFGVDIIYSMKNKRYEAAARRRDIENAEDFLDVYSEAKYGRTDSNEMLLFYSFVKSMIRSEYYFPPVNVAQNDSGENTADYGLILRMMEDAMKLNMSQSSLELSDCIEYHISEHFKSGQKIKFNRMLCVLLDSMKKRLLVKFIYNGTEVHVEPIRIIHYEGKWYFMGFIAESLRPDHLKKVRTYNLSMIEGNIHLTGKDFTGEEYVIPEYKDSFGIIASTNTKTAVIRFYENLAVRMKELLWYDGQITETGRDEERGNYCQYTLPYPSNTSFELISKVLSFGDRAEIIEPEELRRSWQDTIKRMFGQIK